MSAPSHTGAPLSIEFPAGEVVDFARLTNRDWARWTNRVAAQAHRAVLRKTLGMADVPAPAAYKMANEELLRPRPKPQVVAIVTSDARFYGRLLREQARAADPDVDVGLIDQLSDEDQRDLAGLLTAEAVLTLPLLAPLSRQRARERAALERETAKRTRVAAILASATRSSRT